MEYEGQKEYRAQSRFLKTDLNADLEYSFENNPSLRVDIESKAFITFRVISTEIWAYFRFRNYRGLSFGIDIYMNLKEQINVGVQLFGVEMNLGIICKI